MIWRGLQVSLLILNRFSSILDKVRRSFNVSVAELDNHDTWQRAAVGIAAIGRETGTVNSLLDKVKNFVTTLDHIAIADFEIEIL